MEAITEVLPLKQRLFKQWDQMCPDKTIFATNTSFLKVKDDMCAIYITFSLTTIGLNISKGISTKGKALDKKLLPRCVT